MVFLGLAFAIATAGLSAAQTGAIDREPAPASQRPEPQAEGGWRIPVLHAAGTLAAMRISASILWPQAYDPTRLPDQFRGLERAWSRLPEFRRDRPLLGSDGDPWTINVFGHGLFGSEIYARTRQCGHGPAASAAAVAATSFAWEYVVEAPYKRPSAVDLVWTPLGGLVFGELRFQLGRWLREGASTPVRTILLVATDPFGELERRVFGTRC